MCHSFSLVRRKPTTTRNGTAVPVGKVENSPVILCCTVFSVLVPGLLWHVVVSANAKIQKRPLFFTCGRASTQVSGFLFCCRHGLQTWVADYSGQSANSTGQILGWRRIWLFQILVFWRIGSKQCVRFCGRKPVVTKELSPSDACQQWWPFYFKHFIVEN